MIVLPLLSIALVIANMYFIPVAIFYGDPQISVSFYIWKSMIPTALGNIVGGGLFVAVPYWYLYLQGENVPIDFNIGSIASAEQAGGPLGPSPSRTPAVQHIIHGREIDHHHPGHQLPHSGANFKSGISRELSADKYGASSPSRDPEKIADNASDSDRTMN